MDSLIYLPALNAGITIDIKGCLIKKGLIDQ
jgi:hypothetical protein